MNNIYNMLEAEYEMKQNFLKYHIFELENRRKQASEEIKLYKKVALFYGIIIALCCVSLILVFILVK